GRTGQAWTNKPQGFSRHGRDDRRRAHARQRAVAVAGGPGGARAGDAERDRLRAARAEGGLSTPGRVQLPDHRPAGHPHARRPAHAGHLRRHGRLPRRRPHEGRAGGSHDPDPQPREPGAPGRDQGRHRPRVRVRRDDLRRQHEDRGREAQDRRARPGDGPGALR
ncbi:MAG: hypothetical protein AVDCRST_MAG22-1639, partial [uncultured Rubrobacteraceae bacterium]